MRAPATLLLAAAAVALTARCGVTAKAALSGSTEDATTCAAQTLASLGYDVVDAPDSGPIRAERAASTRANVDRITVLADSRNLRVVGQTLRQPATAAAFGSRTRLSGGTTEPAPTFPSREIRDDVHAVATACGSAPQ
jgi:hypothetical protein